LFRLALPAAAQSKDERKRQKELQEALQRSAPVVVVVNQLQSQQVPETFRHSRSTPRERPGQSRGPQPRRQTRSGGLPIRHDEGRRRQVYVPYTVAFRRRRCLRRAISSICAWSQGRAAAAAEQTGDDQGKNRVAFAFEDYFSVQRVRGGSRRASPRFAAHLASTTSTSDPPKPPIQRRAKTTRSA